MTLTTVQILHRVSSPKTAQLTAAFRKKSRTFPVKPDFSWGRAFAETKDGLPYIGSIKEHPDTFLPLVSVVTALPLVLLPLILYVI